MITDKKTALLLIDIQQGFEELEYWGKSRNNPDAEQKAAELLAFWRQQRWPIYHIKHNSLEENSPLRAERPGNKIQDVVAPVEGEPVISKHVASGFIGTNLKYKLDTEGIEALVICGLTTDHCVSTTTRMANNLGFETYLVADACATFSKKSFEGEVFDAETIHKVNITSLKDEFATILNTEQIIEAKA